MDIPKKKIIISAVNITEGGSLTVLLDCLKSAENNLSSTYIEIEVILNSKLIYCDTSLIKVTEISCAKKSWILRIFIEYIFFWFYSKKIKPDIWFSFHDITPNVVSKKQIVYCHNPSLFYQPNLKEFILDPKFYIFTKFYKYIYGINIKKNLYVVVQQNWIKKRFEILFKIKNVLVARPTRISQAPRIIESYSNIMEEKLLFYPAFPRVFKNFEVICDAIEKISSINKFNFKLILTIKGDENWYAKKLYRKYSHNHLIMFIGIQGSKEISNIYNKCSAVLFPSKLETWGMPLTEAIQFQKPILAADLEYARETIGLYQNATFISPDNSSKWAVEIINHLEKKEVNFKENFIPPFAQKDELDWDTFWKKIGVLS